MQIATETRHAVAANVRAEMARQGCRQVAAAEALGLSQPALSRRLTGAIAFDVDELAKLAQLLSVSVSVLMPEDSAEVATAVPA